MKRDYDCGRASVSSVARPSAIWCADTARRQQLDALRRQLPQPYSAVLFQQRQLKEFRGVVISISMSLGA